MRRSQRPPKPIRDDNFILPESSEGSNADDTDEDPDFDPADVGQKRLERFLSKHCNKGMYVRKIVVWIQYCHFKTCEYHHFTISRVLY